MFSKKDLDSLILCHGFGLTIGGHLQDLGKCRVSGHHRVTYSWNQKELETGGDEAWILGLALP